MTFIGMGWLIALLMWVLALGEGMAPGTVIVEIVVLEVEIVGAALALAFEPIATELVVANWVVVSIAKGSNVGRICSAGMWCKFQV